MAVEVKHSTVVVVPDDGTSPVGSDEWNATHQLTLTGPALLGRDAAGAGAAAEISVGSGLALSAGALSNADRGSTAVGTHVAAGDPHPQYSELAANETAGGDKVFTGEVSFGDPGTEAGSITVNGAPYDAIVKINEFGGTRDAALILHRHATSTAAVLAFSRARGTDQTHVNVQSGDVIGYLDFVGWHTASYYRCAEVTAEIDGTPGAADMPGRLVFKVTPDGSQTPAEALRISQNRVANFAVTPTVAGATIWHSGNDGSGSGLDADTVDGADAAALLARANHTGTQASSTISDFDSASRAQTEAALIAGTNITITPAGSGATRTLTIAAAGGGAGTNLAYDAATRVLSSDTGSDATLPLMSSSNAGLVPASGGGTTNFLRADGTFAAPPGGGGGVTFGQVVAAAAGYALP